MSYVFKPKTLEEYEADLTKALQDKTQLPIGSSTQALIHAFALSFFNDQNRMLEYFKKITPKTNVDLDKASK